MTSIDGLITGLNTTQIISQLMQLERAPQTRLKQRQTDAQKIETELREMRSDVQAIRNLAADLRLGSGWDQLKATSSEWSRTTYTSRSPSRAKERCGPMPCSPATGSGPASDMRSDWSERRPVVRATGCVVTTASHRGATTSRFTGPDTVRRM